MKKLIRRLTRIELVLIFLVIIAGSVVRMTGSGMGCPDWPKCFGYLIPPTERSQLEWQANREFQEGQIIILDESLQVANSDFVTGENFDESNWEPYTKHDYALFNPSHTWTEYINRLFGAASGVPMLILFVVGLIYIRKDWRNFVLASAGLFLLAFEAWLGKLVVDGNLIPGSITIHMIGALSIIAVLLVLLGLNQQFPKIRYTHRYRNLLILSLILTLFQIIIGTQVREQIDILNAGDTPRIEWAENLGWEFYFHRSFSILLVLLNGWLWWINRRLRYGFKEMNWIILILVSEVIIGISLNYFAFPRLSQPAHLLLGTVLFSLQTYTVIRVALSEHARVIAVK